MAFIDDMEKNDWYTILVEELVKKPKTVNMKPFNPLNTRSNDLKKARVLNMLLEIDEYEMCEILPLITKFFGRFPLSNKDVMRGEVKGTLTVVGYSLLRQNLDYRKILYQDEHLMIRQSFTRMNMKRVNLEKLLECDITDLERFEILIKENLHFTLKGEVSVSPNIDHTNRILDLLLENEYTANAENSIKRYLFDALVRIGYQDTISDDEYDSLTFKFYQIAKSLAIRLKNVHPTRCHMIQSYRRL